MYKSVIDIDLSKVRSHPPKYGCENVCRIEFLVKKLSDHKHKNSKLHSVDL